MKRQPKSNASSRICWIHIKTCTKTACKWLQNKFPWHTYTKELTQSSWQADKDKWEIRAMCCACRTPDLWRFSPQFPATCPGNRSWLLMLCMQPTVPCTKFTGTHSKHSDLKKVKVTYTRLPSVRFRGWSQFLAVISPAVGCLPGLQLPSQPLRGLLPILLLGEQGHDRCEQFA